MGSQRMGHDWATELNWNWEVCNYIRFWVHYIFTCPSETQGEMVNKWFDKWAWTTEKRTSWNLNFGSINLTMPFKAMGPEIIRGVNRDKIEKRVKEYTCPWLPQDWNGQRDEEGAVSETETQRLSRDGEDQGSLYLASTVEKCFQGERVIKCY